MFVASLFVLLRQSPNVVVNNVGCWSEGGLCEPQHRDRFRNYIVYLAP